MHLKEVKIKGKKKKKRLVTEFVLHYLNAAFGNSKELSVTSGNFKTPSIKAFQKPSFFNVLTHTFSFLNFEYQRMGCVTQKLGASFHHAEGLPRQRQFDA